MKKFILFIALAAIAIQSRAANSFLISASVQSQVDAQGQGADACQYAGVTLVRDGYPNESAIQLGSNAPGDPTRIFTAAGSGSYFLTDAGSQWVSGIGTNQRILAVVETLEGSHGWSGTEYVGASTFTIDKPSYVAGSVAMPALIMTRPPRPELVLGAPDKIVLDIPAPADPSGLGVGLRLWKRPAGDPSGPWSSVQDLPWMASGSLRVTDTAVTDGTGYIYGVSHLYAWQGGAGIGAAELTNHYVSFAKNPTKPYFASILQPTATPFPTLVPPIATPNIGNEPWVAYPNPLVGSDLRLAFKTEKAKSQYWASFYSIDGAKVLEIKGQAPQAGWQKPALDLGKLAPGIYLVRLRVIEPGKTEVSMPVRKLAVVK